ncbi:ATP-grasp fold amidoligase family protein [Salinimonas sediminis]|uniref:ATP-grasp domain-containing protein n=1 Tax=Salinimonas sediminis TaxID=2303538 RepID=A0A346NQN2_9ALTE|nr:ATP-grasp fold amidoligase family protein [Salinimonas sediminis]AXR07839.1 hypothetical protein D0Y50_16635 [Salinimonas sediminis]
MTKYNELEQRLDSLMEAEVRRKNEKRQVIRELFAQIKDIKDDLEARKTLFTKLQVLTDAGDMPENTLRGILSKGWNLNHLPSFRALVTLDTCRRKIATNYSAWPLNDKGKAVQFIDMLDVPRPKVYEKATTLSQINITSYPCIIKPLHGATSSGVVIAFAADRYRIVRNGTMLSHYAEVEKHLLKMLKVKSVSKDLWQIEEFIADIDRDAVRAARDLKFYCFYGKVGHVLEVEREKGGKFRTRYPDGTFAKGSEFEGDAEFPVTNFTPEDIKLAERISKEIPVPFLSIDFLKTDDRMVFCEFTPRPGVYGQYKPEFDAYLGHLYLGAEARLQKDFIRGKKFANYQAYLNAIKND